MPREAADTVKELLQGFNSFQASLGLMPGAQSGGTAFQPPQVKHPGQVSQEMSAQLTQMAQQTLQSAHTIRSMAAPNALPMTAVAATAAPPMPPAVSQFASDFGQRMQQIQQNYLSPWAAQGIAGMTGMQGFQGLPSPIMMTPPHMGIYRPPMGPPPTPFLARDRPIFPHPMQPMIPPPMFQTPFEQRYQEAVTANETMFAGAMAGAGTAGGVAAGLGTMALGGRAGAGLMRRIGVPEMARMGRIGGLIGGAALGFGAIAPMAERGVAGLLEPSVQARALGQQLEVASRNFVVSGPQLSELGRGLSTRAAVGVTNRMQDMISQGQIQGFNIRDMTRMTAQAGQMGMLDMAQGGEQIAQTMRNLARNLQVFMRLAQEPDVSRAMQQMASMRSMGLTIPETTMAMQNAYQFAKQAGTTTRGLMQTAGLPGAMTFQQLGMTAGLGMNVGMGAAAMARQAVAGGVYTPGQLAMAGGAQGIGQSLTEAAGATLGVNFQTMAMMTRNAQGDLAIDPRRLRGLMSGRYGLGQQAEMGADMVSRLGGERAITEMHTRINELRDQMGRSLGPQGSAMLLIRQALNTQRELGGANVMSLGGALQMIAPNMGVNQIRSIEQMASSPRFWRNMEQWQERRIGEMRQDEARRRESDISEGGVWGRTKRWVGTPIDDMMSGFRQLRRGISEWWTTRERQQRASERGERFIDTTDEDRWRTVPGAERAETAQRQFIQSGGFERYMQQYGGELTRGGAGRDTSRPGRYGAAAWNVFGGFFTGGLAPRAYSVEGSTNVAMGRMRGQMAGWLAENLPSVYALTQLGAKESPEQLRERAEGASQHGMVMQRALQLSGRDARRLEEQNTRTLNAFVRQTGQGNATAFRDALADEMRTLYKSKSSFGKDQVATQAEVTQAVQRAGQKAGFSNAQATQLASTDRYREAYVGEAVRQLRAEGNTDVNSVIANQMGETSNYLGKKAGDQLENLLKDARDWREKGETALGLTADIRGIGGIGGVRIFDKEVIETAKNILVTNNDEDLMGATIHSLNQQGRTEEAAKLQKQLADRVAKKGKRVTEYLERGAGLVGSDKERQRIFASMGSQLAKTDDAMKTLEVAKGKILASRTVTDLQAGAASAAKAGVTSLADVTPEQLVGKDTGADSLQNRLRRMLGSEQERTAAGSVLTGLARRATEEGISDKERAQRMREVQSELSRRGGRRDGGVSVGGTGGGGAQEGEAEQTLDEIRKLSKEAMKDSEGKAQTALAAAVPTFFEGAMAMKEAAERLDNAAQSGRLNSMVPP